MENWHRLQYVNIYITLEFVQVGAKNVIKVSNVLTVSGAIPNTFKVR